VILQSEEPLSCHKDRPARMEFTGCASSPDEPARAMSVTGTKRSEPYSRRPPGLSFEPLSRTA
jgi:hypothetical protein